MKARLSTVLAFGVAIPILASATIAAASEWGSLPAPTHKQVVLHGVSVDWDHGTIRPESIPVLDEAATALGQSEATLVVAATDDIAMPRRLQIPPQQCPQDIVRNYLATHGVNKPRVTELVWLSPDPIDNAVAACQIGFLSK